MNTVLYKFNNKQHQRHSLLFLVDFFVQKKYKRAEVSDRRRLKYYIQGQKIGALVGWCVE